MKRFQFKLEATLRIKKRLEEERQLELHLAETARMKAERQYYRRQDQIRETAAAYQRLLTEKVNLQAADDYNRYWQWLHQMLEREFHHLCYCQSQVKEAREKLLAATKEKKSLEKLKERAYREHQALELSEEIKFMDELGTNRFLGQKARDKGDPF